MAEPKRSPKRSPILDLNIPAPEPQAEAWARTVVEATQMLVDECTRYCRTLRKAKKRAGAAELKAVLGEGGDDLARIYNLARTIVAEVAGEEVSTF